ncbi:MAG: hypothetical protein IJR63_11025 [Synergistaceae bacterium]|nr:hypothetical protein [Synergistaceae bacterium]
MTSEEFIDFVVSAASGLKFTYHNDTEEDGSVTVWVNELALSVNAKSQEQAMADILESMRDFADCYCEGAADWGKRNPDLLGYVVKILTGTDEDLAGELAPPEGVEPNKYRIWRKETPEGRCKYTNFPEETSDEPMPAKYWEHKRDKELMISDDDLD